MGVSSRGMAEYFFHSLETTSELRVLVLEDDVQDLALTREMLHRSLEKVSIQVADGRQSFENHLKNFYPHLILADYFFPHLSGLDALHLSLKQTSYLPFIFLTAARGEEKALEALKAGASDFVSKKNLSRLPQAIHRALREAQEKNARRASETYIEALFASSKDAICSIDLQHRILAFNKTFGHFVEQLQKVIPQNGESIFSFIPRKDHRIWKVFLKNVLGQGQSKFEYQLNPNKLLEVTAYAIRQQNKISGLSLFLRDISQRKKEESLQQKKVSQQFFSHQKESRIRKEALLLGQEQERERISRDLHDSLGQSLSSLALEMSSLTRLIKDDLKEQSMKLLGQIQRNLGQALAEMREISQDLSPRILKDFGLEDIILHLKNKIEKNSGIEVSLQIQSRKRFDKQLELHVYRIVQECLANILKHAEAKHIRLVLKDFGHYLSLIIQDDGIGFSPKAPSLSSLGLLNIEERVLLMDGQLQILTNRDEGTKMIIEIPL